MSVCRCEKNKNPQVYSMQTNLHMNETYGPLLPHFEIRHPASSTLHSHTIHCMLVHTHAPTSEQRAFFESFLLCRGHIK